MARGKDGQMNRKVMKFGGTSLRDLDRMRVAAARVIAERQGGAQIAVVVSAMAGETDRLAALIAEAGGDRDEGDAALATGEQVSAALMAMTLSAMGQKARSFQGWQAGLVTSASHGKARIEALAPEALEAALADGEIPVITGFQGVTPEGRITTLGRGGSDLTAVAAAAALGAECDIYTDVDGIYSADPRIAPRARRLASVSYDEMLEMASLGAKVLHARSVELAKAQGVKLRVVSSLIPLDQANPGTRVISEDESMERHIISGVTYSRDEAKITLMGIKSDPATPAALFTRLAEADVNADMIAQSPSKAPDRANLVFSVGRAELARAAAAIEAVSDSLGAPTLETNADVAKVSVIGLGMRSHSGAAMTMFKALSDKGVPALAIAASEIKISVLVDSEYTELAVRALHNAFGLDED